MKIAITCSDGGVAIMTLAIPEDAYLLRAATLEKWKELNPGAYAGHREIPDGAIPADRTYRNAWESDGGSITINMDKAREIHCNHLRQLREPLLAELDVEYMRADEQGDADLKAELAKKKQALRDVTRDPCIEEAKTTEELKRAIPDILRTDK